MNDPVCQYEHVDGFQDGTKHLEVDGSGRVTIVTWGGKREPATGYTVAECEKKVARGIWKKVVL